MSRVRMILVLLGWCWAGVAGADDSTNAASVPQIQIEAVIYEVDSAKLAKLADKTKSPVAELLKLNGFNQVVAIGEHPVFVLATRKEPLSFDIHGQETVLAFKRLTAPTVTVLSGRGATVHFGGQFPILIPADSKSDRDTAIHWRDFGTMLTLVPIVEPGGRIKLEVCVNDSRLNDAAAVVINGVAIPGLTIKRAYVQGEFQLPGHLLIAIGTSESDLTQIVQLTPRLLPQTEIAKLPPAPIALPAPPKAASVDRRQVQFDVTVWDVNLAALRALTKSDLGVHEFYKVGLHQNLWVKRGGKRIF